MVASVIIILRVLLAAGLGAVGLLMFLIGIYLPLERDFALLGGPGAVALVLVLIGLGLLYGSGRLFKNTLTIRQEQGSN